MNDSDATALLDTEVNEQRDRAEEAYNQTLIENPDMAEPLRPDLNDGPLSALSPEQRVRVAALNMARPVLSAKSVLGASSVPDLSDLIRLATWILDGNEEPLYPYLVGETLILGPDISVDIDSDLIHWKGYRYLKELDDEN
jgi:hypothetical protein